MPPWNADGPLVVVEADGRPLYRLVSRAAFRREDWQSHYETGMAPRHLEKRAAIDHMGVSMWARRSNAVALMEAYPKLASMLIAEVEIEAGSGFWMAQTQVANHWTVWGWPESFERWILDVKPA